MGLFKCSKCNCVENTALGLYWTRNRIESFEWDESNEGFKGMPLCSECAPKSYSDTHEPTKWGEWHGKFPKQHISELTPEQKKDIYYI